MADEPGDQLSPDWAAGSQFRRYLLFPGPLTLALSKQLTAALQDVDLHPYLPWYTRGGVVLVPQRPDLEKFYLLPLERVSYARTARDPEHDAALVRIIRAVNTQLRQTERDRGLPPFALGKSMCDDCGAHPEHRSRRMITNHWPVADGSTCAPWKGAWFNQTYGETQEGDTHGSEEAHQDGRGGGP